MTRTQPPARPKEPECVKCGLPPRLAPHTNPDHRYFHEYEKPTKGKETREEPVDPEIVAALSAAHKRGQHAKYPTPTPDCPDCPAIPTSAPTITLPMEVVERVEEAGKALIAKVNATSECDHTRQSCKDIGCIGHEVKMQRAALSTLRAAMQGKEGR